VQTRLRRVCGPDAAARSAAVSNCRDCWHFEKLLVANQHRVLLLFEGRDAAGKGGTIKRIDEHLNPRGTRVVALIKPSDRERTQW
jgi:polyphosphate kinase 2 (PPK2 family)